MISSGAAMKAAHRILRAIRGYEPDPIEIALAATLIVKEVEIDEKKPVLTVIEGGKSA